MKKRIGIAIVIGILALLLVHLEGKKGEGVTIVSDDGNVSLVAPSGHENITINSIDRTNEGALMAYEFGPSGTTFDDPLTVSFDVSNLKGDVIPMLMDVNGDEPVPVANTKYSVDPLSGEATLSGEIHHFSEYHVVWGYFKASYPPDLGSEHVVGDRFWTQIKIEVNTERENVFGRKVELSPRPSADLEVITRNDNAQFVDLSPNESRTDMDPNIIVWDKELECIDWGPERPSYFSEVHYYYENGGTLNKQEIEMHSYAYCQDPDIWQTVMNASAECDGSVEVDIVTDEFRGENVDIGSYTLKIVGEDGLVTERRLEPTDVRRVGEGTDFAGVEMTFTDEFTVPAGQSVVKIEVRENIEPGKDYEAMLIRLPQEVTEAESVIDKVSFAVEFCPLDDVEVGLMQPGVGGDTTTTSGFDYTGEVIMLQLADGSLYPELAQFIIGNIEARVYECDGIHYRARGANVYGLKSLDSNEIVVTPAVPASTGCGYGLYKDFERTAYRLTADQIEALSAEIPNLVVNRIQ